MNRWYLNILGTWIEVLNRFETYCFKKEISRSCEMIMIQYCLGKVLVSFVIYYSHGREVGLPTVVCHDVVSLDVCYFHGREVGLPTVVCHDVVSLDVCYFHGREVGLPTVVCHDVMSLVIFRYLWFWYFHGYFYDIDGYICFMLDLYVAKDSDYSFLKNHVG